MNTYKKQPDETEAAAALAAVERFLAEEKPPLTSAPPEARSRWHESNLMARQGLRPQRLPAVPGWATIERIRRQISSGP